MNKTYPCPCCGYLVFDEPLGSYQICPFCFWEDDFFQLKFATTHDGGPNNVSLLEAQRNHQALGACIEAMRKHVRAPGPESPRDPTWRPINEGDLFPDWDTDTLGSQPEYGDFYYWRRHAAGPGK